MSVARRRSTNDSIIDSMSMSNNTQEERVKYGCYTNMALGLSIFGLSSGTWCLLFLRDIYVLKLGADLKTLSYISVGLYFWSATGDSVSGTYIFQFTHISSINSTFLLKTQDGLKINSSVVSPISTVVSHRGCLYISYFSSVRS